MEKFLNQIVEKTLSFFFDKGADTFLSKVKQKIEYHNLQKRIRDYSERYFKDRFYQIPLTEEFDFDGLNNYLYDNFYDKVTPCLTAPDHRQRLFFIEQLYRQSYEYAEASDHRKQNTVYVYIENILKITEAYFVGKIDDKKWFLANHIVDQITESLQAKLQKYDSELKEFIAYHGSFAENIDNIRHVFRTDKQYHYLNKKIRFFGRSDEFRYLDSFLSESDELLFTVITSPGGAGKSKLMYHYMQRNIGNLDWKIIFPTHEQIKRLYNFNEYKYPENLLIIIDYAGEIAETVGKWLDNLIRSYDHPQKLRMVLLERQNSNNDNKIEPYWYQELYRVNPYSIKECCYKQKFYRLEPLKKSELFLLMDNIAENEEKQLCNNEKESIYNRSLELNCGKDEKYFNTPLMIILITDALLNGQDIKLFDTKKLMEYIIEKNQRYWKNTICESNEQLYDSLSKLLVYATAEGGWDLRPLDVPLTDDSKRFLNQYSKTKMQEHFLDLLSNNEENNMMLMPLEPDPIGEYFVLWFLSEHTYHTDYRKLITLLWSTPVKFAHFLGRCIDSYLYQSLFDSLIYGEYAIIFNNSMPIFSANLLVRLATDQPTYKAEKTVQILADYTKSFIDNEKIAFVYAQGLVNLSSKQEANAAEKTIQQLHSLLKDHPGNEEIAIAYAYGIVNLIYIQDVTSEEKMIKVLYSLLKNYSDNQEIAIAYAQGLFNLSSVQNIYSAKKTIACLQSLSKGYSCNQKIAQTYAQGLVNLALRQDVATARETVGELHVLLENYPKNQEIALQYSKSLVNLSAVQESDAAVETVGNLCSLHEGFPKKQEIAIAYAQGLFNLSVNQESGAVAKTVGKLRFLHEGYPENQELAIEYAEGLANLTIKQESGAAAETVDSLCSLYKDYRESQELAIAYAHGLVNLTTKQGPDAAVETVRKLCFVHEDYPENQELAIVCAKGIVNLSAKQEPGTAAETVEEICSMQEDYPENQKLAIVCAKGLFNLFTRQELGAAAETVGKLCSMHEDYPENQEVAIEYAKGLVNLSTKQEPDTAAETVGKLCSMQEGYPENQELAIVCAIGLFNLFTRQEPDAAKKTSEQLRLLLKKYPDLSKLF